MGTYSCTVDEFYSKLNSLSNTATTHYFTITDVSNDNYYLVRNYLSSFNSKSFYIDLSSTIYPNTIINMNNAFFNCKRLVKAPSIPNSVTNMKNCFSDCENFNQSITIPNTVIDMEGCFDGCAKFNQSITIPNSVTNMRRCFDDCTNFNQPITISNSVTDMRSCFNGCTNFNQPITIPNTVTDMGNCFSICRSFNQNVIIPDSVTNLRYCFYVCTSLTEITIQNPDNITNWELCFQGCSHLNKINVPVYYNESEIWHLYKISTDSTALSAQIKILDPDLNLSTTEVSYASISSSTIIKAGGKTDLIAVSGSITDEQVEKMMKYSKALTTRQVLDPEDKNFVMWADDPDNVVTNLTFPSATALYVVNVNSEEADTSKTGSCATFPTPLRAGMKIYAVFGNGNSATNPTLNVENTGAYEIRVNGVACGEGIWEAGSRHELMFDGDYWELLDNGGVVKNVITSYNKGYRIMSNGYCEQWGYYTYTGSKGNGYLPLTIGLKTIEQATTSSNYATANIPHPLINLTYSNRSGNTINKLYCYMDVVSGYSLNINWYVSGFIADGVSIQSDE